MQAARLRGGWLARLGGFGHFLRTPTWGLNRWLSIQRPGTRQARRATGDGSTPAPPAPKGMSADPRRASMTLQGDLTTLDLTSLFQSLDAAGKTGLLTVRDGDEETLLYFERGSSLLARPRRAPLVDFLIDAGWSPHPKSRKPRKCAAADSRSVPRSWNRGRSTHPNYPRSRPRASPTTRARSSPPAPTPLSSRRSAGRPPASIPRSGRSRWRSTSGRYCWNRRAAPIIGR